jgi:hypothetical protein
MLPQGLTATTRAALPPSGRGEREPRSAASAPSAATSRAHAKVRLDDAGIESAPSGEACEQSLMLLQSGHQVAQQFVSEIAEESCSVASSLDNLHQVWPSVLRALVTTSFPAPVCTLDTSLGAEVPCTGQVESTLQELEEDASLLHLIQDPGK